MRQEKQLLSEEIKQQVGKHGSFVIVSYSALQANKAAAFRRQIGKHGGDIQMMRKRILLKAADDLGIGLDLSSLPGHIGIVFCGSDAVVTTKEVFSFAKETGNAVNVVGGRFEGKLYSAGDVEKLSKLPGLKDMQAQLLSVFEAPMSQTLAVMEALLTSVVFCLDNKSKQSSDQ